MTSYFPFPNVIIFPTLESCPLLKTIGDHGNSWNIILEIYNRNRGGSRRYPTTSDDLESIKNESQRIPSNIAHQNLISTHIAAQELTSQGKLHGVKMRPQLRTIEITNRHTIRNDLNVSKRAQEEMKK